MQTSIPNCETLSKFETEVRGIYEFFEYLQGEEIFLSKQCSDPDYSTPITETLEKLICKWLKIDYVKLEKERQMLLQTFRKSNKG